MLLPLLRCGSYMGFCVLRLSICTDIWLFVFMFKIDLGFLFLFFYVWDGNIIGLYCVFSVIEF